ncbi:MAG: hypothetical protein M3Y69_10155 [Verrucomicrobiota bacterium]|nr:hypothetical protein [Verrucomicrobiota bacterium]
MKITPLLRLVVASFAAILATSHAAPTNIAEDDASKSEYGGGWDSGKNGGNGFGSWAMTSDATGENRHAGFYIATTDNNKDLNGIAKEGKAFGIFANGEGFEQAVAFRSLIKPLAVGDSFSFMIENGRFEKKFEKDESGGGAVGLVLRTGNSASAPTDYNAGAMFEFGYYQGSDNYQIYDGTKSTDSGVAFTDAGLTVTVTVTGSDSYDLEIQNMSDKKLTKLPGRKFSSSGSIESFAVFNRNSEKNDVFVNQFQIARDEK